MNRDRQRLYGIVLLSMDSPEAMNIVSDTEMVESEFVEIGLVPSMSFPSGSHR